MTDTPPVATATTTTTVSAPVAAPTVKDYVPETRTWLMGGLFGMVFYILHSIVQNPHLEDSKLFFGIATMVTGTAFIGALGFYFGASLGKSGGSAVSTSTSTSTDTTQ